MIHSQIVFQCSETMVLSMMVFPGNKEKPVSIQDARSHCSQDALTMDSHQVQFPWLPTGAEQDAQLIVNAPGQELSNSSGSQPVPSAF